MDQCDSGKLYKWSRYNATYLRSKWSLMKISMYVPLAFTNQMDKSIEEEKVFLSMVLSKHDDLSDDRYIIPCWECLKYL